MRRLAGLLAAVFTSVIVSGCSLPSSSQDGLSGLVHPSVLSKAGLKYYWNASVPLKMGERVRAIYRLDENVYCVTTQNRLIAADAMTGRYKWAYEAARPDETLFEPIHSDSVALSPRPLGIGEILSPMRVPTTQPVGAVMINTLTNVVVLNRSTGEAIRKPGDVALRGNNIANTAGATDGIRFYVGSPNGEYSAFRLQEGIRDWTMFTSAQPIMAPLVWFDGHLYITNEGGALYCTRTGHKAINAWEKRLDAGVVGGIYVDSRGCFVPCLDHRIYAYKALTGEPLWQFICDGELRKPIQVGENSVFQYAERDKFYCLDVASGRLRWPAIPDGRMALAAKGGDVYVRDGHNNLLVIDEMLGSRKISLPMTGHELFVPNASAPVIYTGRSDGRLFCITDENLSHLTIDVLKGKKK